MTMTQTQSTSPERGEDAGPAVRAFTRLLRANASVTRLLSAELLEEHGLSINDYEALLVLSRADGQRLKRVDIARQLLLTPSGITRLLEGLERAGWVCKRACDSDARVTYAVLTEAGYEKLKEASRTHHEDIGRMFTDHFSEQELDELSELLGRLVSDPRCMPG